MRDLYRDSANGSEESCNRDASADHPHYKLTMATTMAPHYKLTKATREGHYYKLTRLIRLNVKAHYYKLTKRIFTV